ncbi:MAG TPA: 4a-hydroxytetrahydrobiopterin dehydratase [Ilumatobacteraceae bacterium]|nr:4a-hydroxytetrahydrobiopterin dehydratase [Ilumatobacteraceae bacterium]
MSDSTLTPEQVAAANLTDWKVHADALHTRYKSGDFVTGLKLVNEIGDAAEAANHHPDLDLRYPHLDIHLSSHDAGGITDRDIKLARRITEIAAGAGVAADPNAVELSR